ncbi:ImmA/IrrE family metallo-endopeptidase [Tissierella creatinophila]|uniref:IrrE N-terminal-like domain-containing protein n=1 Tax=Tissierella creatinophila DSM 6911 TaxID=1123403 RepID=A0A1U7M6N8_TISCR|nr:ImmA/IrrE family metallo-endopeptidase [Tissierella creatinophila]OLS02920.1 hypothetical protein TICRE_10740 [Tissierella creatinophila DSM 6911]
MYEELVKEAEKENIEVVEIAFRSKKIKGLYSDGVIATNKNMSDKDKLVTLAEEIGHYYTSYGDILDQTDIVNRKQERQARIWAYKKLIGITNLINAYEAGVQNRYELSEYLGITEEFIEEALDYYKQLYGLYVTLDNYVVYFEPLGIMKIL